MASEPARQMAEEAGQEPAIAVDNAERRAQDTRDCPTCGRAFTAKGRNRHRIVHCSARCRNRAWALLNRPPVAKRRKRGRLAPPDPAKANPAMVAAMARGLRALLARH